MVLLYSPSVMMKRLGALILMLVLAGQILAGVCECLSGDDSHSCCEKSQELTLKRPPCCTDGDCLSSGDSRQYSTNLFSIRFSGHEHAVNPGSTELKSFQEDAFPESVLLKSFEGESPPLTARDLFITHHEILI
jgi:hypothetical protein